MEKTRIIGRGTSHSEDRIPPTNSNQSLVKALDSGQVCGRRFQYNVPIPRGRRWRKERNTAEWETTKTT